MPGALPWLGDAVEFGRNLSGLLATCRRCHGDVVLGRRDGALDAIERAAAVGVMDVAWLERCPLFDQLRAEPRFTAAGDVMAARASRVVAGCASPSSGVFVRTSPEPSMAWWPPASVERRPRRIRCGSARTSSAGDDAIAVMLYFRIDYPGRDDVTTLDIDDLSFIEWREAAAMPDRFGDYDWVRNDGDGAVEIRAPGLGATTPPSASP